MVYFLKNVPEVFDKNIIINPTSFQCQKKLKTDN